MSTDSKNLFRHGKTTHDEFECDLSSARAGWNYSSVRVVQLDAYGSTTIDSGSEEFVLLPLSGRCSVQIGDTDFELTGRSEIWSDITDYLYIPPATTFVLSSGNGGRFALAGAAAPAGAVPRYCPREEVLTSIRGAGSMSRQVNNYALGNRLETSRLLVTEVLTPGGNWSSYPPHKHDEHSEVERELEEIYYYQVRPGKYGSDGFAFQRIYSSSAGEVDFCAEVRNGDIVVMPYGYHGPAAAAPGYDLYYLNVMAGPEVGAPWLATDDPVHAWLRETWDELAPDQRLPMTPMNPQA